MSSMGWTTACPDWEQRIVAKQSMMPVKPLFPKVAEHALSVFKELVLVDVIGQPTIGEVTRDWVFEFVAAIFGAYDPGTKKRLIRDFFLLISKKNTKSTMAAGIMLTALILNSRESAELIILAPTKEVADNAFTPARDMIRADPELKDMMNVSEHTRTITHLGTNSTFKVVAADSDTVGGKKATFVLIDELHLFGKNSKASSMFREATGGLASRPEGFVIYLSTQSDEPPAGVFKQYLDLARDVRDGKVINTKFLPLIYEFPQSMIEAGDHLKPENFYITNPNLGASVDIDYILDEYQKAQQLGEKEVRDFCAKSLNIEIGINLRGNRWAGGEFWLPRAKVITLEALIEASEVITQGIDGGGLDDLLGFAVLGRLKKSRVWWLWTHAWCHEIVLERRKSEASKLKDFEKQGNLTIVKEVGDDISALADIAKQVFDSGKLDKIGLDPLGIGGLLDGLLDVGIPEECLIAVPQGIKLAGYIHTTERKLAGREMFHGGQPMMAWCVGNAKGVMKGNAIMITKQESGTGKIDPLLAAFNAVALMSQNPQPPQKDHTVFFI